MTIIIIVWGQRQVWAFILYFSWLRMNTENVDIELFINLVRSYPYIYDKGNKMYKDIKRKENAWLKIGETVNLPHDVCQKYFVSLREKYMRERKKQRNLKSGSGMCNKPKWVWFDDMSFLDEHIQERRPTYSNLKVSNDNISNSEPIEEAEENNDLQHLFDNDEFRYDQEIESVNIESEDNEISPVITPTPVRPTKKKKTTTSSTPNSDPDPLEATILKVIADSRNSDSAFGNMVAAELANMNYVDKKIAKRKIMEILFD